MVKKYIMVLLVGCILSSAISVAQAQDTTNKMKNVAIAIGMIKTMQPKTSDEAKMQKKQEKQEAKEAAKMQKAMRAEALEKVQQKAEAGDIQAMYILGWAYYTGQEIDIDEDLAISWWRKAADGMYPDADAWIGLSFEQGFSGVNKNQDSANRYYERGIERGSSYSAALLGIEKYNQNTQHFF